MNLDGEIDVTVHKNVKVNNAFSITTILFIISAFVYLLYKFYENRIILGTQISDYLKRSQMALSNIEINNDVGGKPYIKVKYM
jgi:hypothetical protein